MKATIYPSAIHGSVTIPPSKSMSHRAIICAALAKGRSIISNVAFSDDINVTIDGMRQLGAHIQAQDSTLIIDGIEDFQHLQKSTVFCKESGSTLRFFIPIFSLCNQEIRFTGQNRLLKRPQKIYADIFQERGLFFAQDEEAITIKEALPFGTYTLTGDVSSQFIFGGRFLPVCLPCQETSAPSLSADCCLPCLFCRRILIFIFCRHLNRVLMYCLPYRCWSVLAFMCSFKMKTPCISRVIKHISHVTIRSKEISHNLLFSQSYPLFTEI